MNRLNEREIIDLFISKFRKISKIEKDDIVNLPIKVNNITIKLILKCDMLVESTDVPAGMRPWQIARKSIVSCISDLCSKGIKPYAFLVSIGIPKYYDKKNIKNLINGFFLVSKEYNVRFLGGDTNESKELVIDCNMIGFTTSHIPERKGAKAGDLILVSGEFGYSASGLRIILHNAKANNTFKTKAVSCVMKPEPNTKFGLKLAKYFSSSMDSSDGLSISLYELARQSKKNFLIDKYPTSKAVHNFAKTNSYHIDELVFFGGEEYEIIATIPESKFRDTIKMSSKLGIKMNVIGKVTAGKGKVFLVDKTGEKKLLNEKGYIHLTN
ncbi:MAG: thiamine-phosphate kinase [Nitrososphaeraceae archaeon]